MGAAKKRSIKGTGSLKSGKASTSGKISVASGSAADIISDLDVSKQAIQRAFRYVALAHGAAGTKDTAADKFIVSRDIKTGKFVFKKVSAGLLGTKPRSSTSRDRASIGTTDHSKSALVPRKKAAKKKARSMAKKRAKKRVS